MCVLLACLSNPRHSVHSSSYRTCACAVHLVTVHRALTPRAQPKKKKKACWDFTHKGACKFGDSCRFSHVSAADEILARKARKEAAAAAAADTAEAREGAGEHQGPAQPDSTASAPLAAPPTEVLLTAPPTAVPTAPLLVPPEAETGTSNGFEKPESER